MGRPDEPKKPDEIEGDETLGPPDFQEMPTLMQPAEDPEDGESTLEMDMGEVPAPDGTMQFDQGAGAMPPAQDELRTIQVDSQAGGQDEIRTIQFDTGQGEALDDPDKTLIEPLAAPGSTSPGLGDSTTGSTRGRLRSGGSSGPSSGSFVSSVPAEGELFAGKYEIIHEIARGGMGVVYKAKQVDLNRTVALKLMLSGGYAGEEERRRFILEAEASARLKHPNIVPVFDIGEIDGKLYFTMDFVEGAPLSSRKKDLDRDQLLEVMIKTSDGVAYAHQRGIIHRDLKPANVMMTADDTPLIMDFGLAKTTEVTEGDDGSHKTREGSVMGTPHYMPPEQAEGMISEIDVRTDVYALGVILYELWCGKLPFESKSISELLMMIFEQEPVAPRRLDPTIDPDMEAIILKAMEKEKSKRYDTAADLKRDLERFRDGLTIEARRATTIYRLQKWTRRNRKGVAIGALVFALVAVLTGFAIYKSQEAARAQENAYWAAIDTAEAGLPDLTAETDAISKQVGAFLAGKEPVDARRKKLPGLVSKISATRSRVEEAAAPVQVPQRADDKERKLLAAQSALGALTTRLDAEAGRLDTLKTVHERLTAAGEALATGRTRTDAAIAALRGGGGQGEEIRYDGLAVAVQDAGQRLERSRGEQSLEDVGGFGAARKELETTLTEASNDLYIAIGLGERLEQQDMPETTLANERLAEVAELRAKVAGAQADAAGTRVALEMSTVAAAFLDVLAQSTDEPAGERLRGARLAQALVQRGLEANAQTAGLAEARFRANRLYAEVLLAMKAYDIFDVETSDPGAFTPADLKALAAAKDQALGEREKLREKLESLGKDVGTTAVETLRTRAAELEALASHPALDEELKGVRAQALDRVRRAIGERAIAEVTNAVAAAEGAAEAAKGSIVESLPAVLAEWEKAERLYQARSDLLSETVVAQGLLTCKRGRAEAQRDAAQALEKTDPPRALQLADAAAGAFRELQEADAVSATVADGVADLAGRLRRLQEKPEGMVLIAGLDNVELGGGPGDRNEARTGVDIKPFYLAQREVTCAEYAAFLASKEYRSRSFWGDVLPRAGETELSVAAYPKGWTSKAAPEGWGDLPVTGISYLEAWGYAVWRGMRLPTDDEWEYAARYQGGEQLEFPWGPKFEDGMLISELRPPGSNEEDQTAAAVFDLGGNVSEWVAYAGADAELAAARGASYLYPIRKIARGAYRLLPRKDYRGPQLGLRLAKDAQ